MTVPGNGIGSELHTSETSTRDAERHVRDLLRVIGEKPEREGLKDTPGRVVRALRELTQGHDEDPATILARTFPETHEGLVIVRDVPFTSLCEHHLLPFTGTATIGYLPRGRVVGLSKIARLVHAFARRLQLQERMTREIADALETHLAPAGVAVIARAKHTCMSIRGVRANATTVTSTYRGSLESPEGRRDFMAHTGVMP